MLSFEICIFIQIFLFKYLQKSFEESQKNGLIRSANTLRVSWVIDFDNKFSLQ